MRTSKKSSVQATPSRKRASPDLQKRGIYEASGDGLSEASLVKADEKLAKKHARTAKKEKYV